MAECVVTVYVHRPSGSPFNPGPTLCHTPELHESVLPARVHVDPHDGLHPRGIGPGEADHEGGVEHLEVVGVVELSRLCRQGFPDIAILNQLM